jgi:3'-phosphoadenosine 5'-phosphosulfate sulfotransferase (PAPS reductase)/FAD synthetase
VVERPQGDLVDEIRERMKKLRGTGKPHWPSATSRYCTSDQKRTQIDKVLRSRWPADKKRDQNRGHELVISAMGMRAQESAARGRKPVVQVASRVTSKALASLEPAEALARQQPGQRLCLDWLPIHHWREADVWAAMGTSTDDLERRRTLYRDGCETEALDGWPAHPAYVFGNQRLSCALCVLASRGDLVNGARHNPELYREYVAIERESGFAFRLDLALADLIAKE